jgi:hypothetical protein
VTHRRWALALGIGLAAAYAAGAALSGHESVLARHPLLDGIAPPPPYDWVSPPPDLAQGNVVPKPKAYTIKLGAGGTEAGVFSTPDLQATVVFQRNAIPAESGKTSVSLRIEPLAPTGFGPAPKGLTVTGNVYRLTAAYRPGNTPVTGLDHQAQVVLRYPTVAGHQGGHVVLRSDDKRRWTKLPTSDAVAQQQVSANTRSLGSFAVGRPPSSGGGGSASTGGGPGPWTVAIEVGVVAIVAGALIFAQLRSRRARVREASTRRAPSGGRPGASRSSQGGAHARRKRKRR